MLMSANTPLMIHLLIIHFLSHVEMITGMIVSCVFVFAGQMKNISGSTVAKIFPSCYRLWRTGNGKQTSHSQWSQIFLTKFCEFRKVCWVLSNMYKVCSRKSVNNKDWGLSHKKCWHSSLRGAIWSKKWTRAEHKCWLHGQTLEMKVNF